MTTLETPCESSTLKPSPVSLKVAHVVLSLDCGGLERVVIDLVSEGHKLDQDVTVVCIERPGTMAPAAKAADAEIVCIDKLPGLSLRAVARLKRLFRDLGPDVVHTHQISALLYAGPAARSAGVPVIVHTEHGKHYAVRRRTRWLGRIAGRYADRFFCVSRDIAAEVAAHRVVANSKIHIAPNGIETRRFRAGRDMLEILRSLRIPIDAPVVGTVGRLSEVKRQDVLINAFASVKACVPEAHLLLVGDGPLSHNLRKLSAELGLSDCVHFAGYQQRPEAYLQLMTVFALTSRSEGMPLVILEAWASGVPVVATRVGGLPELIDQGKTGLLSSPGDDTTLAADLCRLLTDKTLAATLSAAGRQRVESMFSVDRMAANYHRHYLEVLQGHARARSH
jgi:sugar transferase (PEP-CTERM/EpsH1 system associated)